MANTLDISKAVHPHITTEYGPTPPAVIYSAFQQFQLNGRMPFVRYGITHTNVKVSPESLFPEAVDVTRRYDTKTLAIMFGCNETCGVLLRYHPESNIDVWVCSGDQAESDRLHAEIMARIPKENPPDDVVNIRVCHMGSNGVSVSVKSIQVPTWAEIAVNYPETAHSLLAKLMSLRSLIGQAK
jgi:hypothetical protein